MSPAYLDNAATTCLDDRVLAAMLPFFASNYGNPSSPHRYGAVALEAVNRAREHVAQLLGCEVDEVYFTSGASEANNTVLKGVLGAAGDYRKHVVVSEIEHKCVLNTCGYLESCGFEVTRVAAGRSGQISPADVAGALTERTALASVMLVNNETGAIQDLESIAHSAHAFGALVHSDCVQAAGRLRFSVTGLHLDCATISSHKIHGPKGVGAAYVRRGLELVPLIHGGGQESGRRGGTENVPGIVGLGEACRLAKEEREKDLDHFGRVRHELLEGLRERRIPFQVNGDPETSVHHIVNLSLGGIRGDTVVEALNIRGVCVSAGSACGSSSAKLSHVLESMNLPIEQRRGAIRISFGRFSTIEDIRELVAGLEHVLARFAVA